MDAWVVRLALPTPQIFDLQPRSPEWVEERLEVEKKPSTPRSVIAGHFVHIDDGRFHEKGRYWSKNWDIEQTAEYISTQEEV